MAKTIKQKIIKRIPLVWCPWGLICGLSSIDQEVNSISLFNVIDQINVSKKDFLKQDNGNIIKFNHEVVVLWKRILNLDVDNDEFSVDIKLKLLDPFGVVLQEILTPLNFEKNKRNMRFRFKLDSIIVTDPGDYVYRIEVQQSNKERFKKEYEIPFEIKEV